MNRICCPECGKDEHDVFNTHGGIWEGWFIEVMECDNCHTVFEVEANFVDIKIKIVRRLSHE